MKLLLVEDDALLGDGVRAGLKQAGFAVDWVQDGLAAKVALDSEEYDLLVLDLGLPKLSGMDLLKSVRAKRASLPVLILTARDTVADRVAGLNAGADDYLVKPFDLDELIARLKPSGAPSRHRCQHVSARILFVAHAFIAYRSRP